MSRYDLASFVVFSAIGRLLWSSLYLGLGYVIGSNIDAASQFLGNLSGLLAALAVLLIAVGYRVGIAKAERP